MEAVFFTGPWGFARLVSQSLESQSSGLKLYVLAQSGRRGQVSFLCTYNGERMKVIVDSYTV